MSSLVRTAVGCFDVSEAFDPSELTREAIDSLIQSPGRAVEELPKLTLNETELRRIANGLAIANRFDEQGVEIAAFDELGSLRAIVKSREAELRPTKFFPNSVSLR